MSTVASASGTQNWGDIQDLIGGQTEKKTKVAEAGDLANSEIFMQLLVAQLKYQNPMNPADGTEFVAQLAQFSQLEQTVGMRDELTAIRETLTSPADGAATQNP